MTVGELTQYRSWIGRLDAGDRSAVDEMLVHYERRLNHLSRLMLAKFPRVRRWEETGDVWHGAILRLRTALQTVRPATPLDFLRLATRQIRWELLRLAKRHQTSAGPSRMGSELDDWAGSRNEPTSATDGPSELADWTEFHEKAGALEHDLHEVFALLFYNGLNQAEAAAVLHVSERTVRERWRAARLKLHDALGGQLPGRR